MKNLRMLTAILVLLCSVLTASAQNYVTPVDSGIYRIVNLK